ncbi:MAG: PIG-L family deacetylase [Candidatus Lokiarchaeia archaeon]
MKIVVFVPHPDDEIFGCGGSVLKWMDEGHNIHIVYVTDNRVLIAWGRAHEQLLEENAKNYINLNEDDVGKICLEEALQVAKSFGFPRNNIHLFKFHDQDAKNQITEGVKLAQNVIKDADRIVLPSDNNNHSDHQATHTIVKKAARELHLQKAEFYVYALYNILKAPKEKQVKINIIDYRNQLYELMKGYKTQLCLKDTKSGWQFLKRKRTERFGVFTYEDMDKFKNF